MKINHQYELGIRILVFFSIIALFSIIIMQPILAADTFDIQTTVCTPVWYCTNFSQGVCGTRDCVDTQGCGFSDNAPDEYIQCPGGGGGSGGGGGGSSSIYSSGTLPVNTGYFKTNVEYIKIDIPESDSQTKTINLETTKNDTYQIFTHYPSNYNQSTSLITVNQQSIQATTDKISEIKLLFNTTGILPGTYIIITEISGSNYHKNISTIVTVNEKNPNKILFEVSVDSDIKPTPAGFTLNASIKINSKIKSDKNSILFSVISPDGEIIANKQESFATESKIRTNLVLPPNLKNGYYTLVAKVISEESSNTKNVQFTVLSEKYHLIEQPTLIKFPSSLTKLIYLLLGSIIGIFAWRVISQKKDKNKENEEELIKAEQKFINLFKNIFQKKQISKPEREKIIQTLFEQGFIKKGEKENLINSIKQAKIITVKETKDEEIKKDEKKEVEKIEEKQIPKTTSASSKKTEDLKKTEVANPVTKKSAPKKTPAKTKDIVKEKDTAEKKRKKELFEKVIRPEQSFYLNNGERLYSIQDLSKFIEKNDLNTFNHHTTQGRNDFANWIDGVFKETKLASQIRKSKDISETKKVIEKYFK